MSKVIPLSNSTTTMSHTIITRATLRISSQNPLYASSRAIGTPCRRLTSIRPRTHALKPQTTTRAFCLSPTLHKKAGKANKAHARTEGSSTPPVNNTGAMTPTDEAYDVSGLETEILKAIEKLTHDLSLLRSGGKMNPEVVEALKVQLGTVSEGKESVRLGDIAQVVPRGRVLNIVCGEEGHIKPISSAIASSPHSLTPLAPEPSNPLTIQVPLPPPTGESRRAAVEASIKAAERADKWIQTARQEHNKKLRKFELNKEVLPDDLQKAKKRMEDVVKKGHTEVKRISDGARRVLEKHAAFGVNSDLIERAYGTCKHLPTNARSHEGFLRGTGRLESDAELAMQRWCSDWIVSLHLTWDSVVIIKG
ncbi:hypothetical protein IAQ61_011315 [Plenodomus lingam]|uniref:uncharacterized protein n=1 Tax=Leptosphaeria maculans TaxID=5022 RepID=UPI003323A308|nr:hypothetical protein IAQ61_011315 [Plenodomus lingam]